MKTMVAKHKGSHYRWSYAGADSQRYLKPWSCVRCNWRGEPLRDADGLVLIGYGVCRDSALDALTGNGFSAVGLQAPA